MPQEMAALTAAALAAAALTAAALGQQRNRRACSEIAARESVHERRVEAALAQNGHDPLHIVWTRDAYPTPR